MKSLHVLMQVLRMAKSGHQNIKRLAKLLKDTPDDSFTKFALALELLKLNEVTKARVLFESILQNDPEYLGVYYHLGKLYESTGNAQQAMQLYNTGIEVATRQNENRTKLELQNALDILISEPDHE